MQLNDFDFHLPEHLIAQSPPPERGQSRLLHLIGHTPHDSHFSQLPQHVRTGDLLIFNNTKVIKARLFGHKASGGRIEALIERVLSDHTVLAHLRASKSPPTGSILHFTDDTSATVLGRQDELYLLQLHSPYPDAYTLLEQHGHLPLPPYIQRPDNDADQQRYQTVYAKERGAVAAPTAGLHFTDAMLHTLQQQGAQLAEITLHVGAGTFRPVRSENIAEHKMHSEHYTVPEATAAAFNRTRTSGGRIWAIGTTTLRCLESAVHQGQLQSGAGQTDIFITPGHRFQSADILLTNFHLPKSTLLMLVSAFAGFDAIRHAYQHAIAQQYRFFSYGDAMLLGRQEDVLS